MGLAKKVGRLHRHDNLPPLEDFELGDVVECRCGRKSYLKEYGSINIKYKYWENLPEGWRVDK